MLKAPAAKGEAAPARKLRALLARLEEGAATEGFLLRQPDAAALAEHLARQSELLHEALRLTAQADLDAPVRAVAATSFARMVASRQERMSECAAVLQSLREELAETARAAGRLRSFRAHQHGAGEDDEAAPTRCYYA